MARRWAGGRRRAAETEKKSIARCSKRNSSSCTSSGVHLLSGVASLGLFGRRQHRVHQLGQFCGRRRHDNPVLDAQQSVNSSATGGAAGARPKRVCKQAQATGVRCCDVQIESTASDPGVRDGSAEHKSSGVPGGAGRAGRCQTQRWRVAASISLARFPPRTKHAYQHQRMLTTNSIAPGHAQPSSPKHRKGAAALSCPPTAPCIQLVSTSGAPRQPRHYRRHEAPSNCTAPVHGLQQCQAELHCQRSGGAVAPCSTRARARRWVAAQHMCTGLQYLTS